MHVAKFATSNSLYKIKRVITYIRATIIFCYYYGSLRLKALCCSLALVFVNFLQLSRNCFIRGSVVRYVQLPPEGVDIELLHDATMREAWGGYNMQCIADTHSATTQIHQHCRHIERKLSSKKIQALLKMIKSSG